MEMPLVAEFDRTWCRHRAIALHRYAMHVSLYPLLACSALACTFLAVRVWWTQSLGHAWLVFNLCLAWVPYLCSLWADGWNADAPGRRGRLLLPAGLWLLFLPNAPYIITDFIHLPNVAGAGLWYDAGLITAFAWAGCFLGIRSLHIMRAIVRSHAGSVAGWLFVLGSCGLAGVGVYIGRFVRWHSWHVFTDPRSILSTTRAAILEPGGLARAIGATLMFAALLLVFYLAFASFERPRERRLSDTA